MILYFAKIVVQLLAENVLLNIIKVKIKINKANALINVEVIHIEKLPLKKKSLLII
jgi:hypothetical protein